MVWFFGDDASKSYADYVSTLDTPIITNLDAFSLSNYEFDERSSVDILGNNSIHVNADSSGINVYCYVSGSGVFKFVPVLKYLSYIPCSCEQGFHLSSSSSAVFQSSSDGGNTWNTIRGLNVSSISVSLSSGYLYRFSFYFPAVSGGLHTLGTFCEFSGGSDVSSAVVPSSTRPASLMQTINNYNTTNNTTSYYIGTTDATGSVNQVYDPNLFDEQIMVFTEPVSGIQYQCVGWKYYYDDRVYVLELAGNSMSYNGTDIKYLGLPGPDVR